MLVNIVRRQLTSSTEQVRMFAAAATASDPIQKLFLDKIREYGQKSKSAPLGLVDADAKTQQALKEDLERLKRIYEIKDGEEGKVTATFSDANLKIDPINMARIK